LGVVGIFLKFF